MTGTLDAFAVILAGGSGTRFWPASMPNRPKQFLPLAGEQPLLLETVNRAEALVGRERVRIVSGTALADATRSLLPHLDEEQFLFEPQPRGTGPALTWATYELWRRDPEAALISMHADHRIVPFEGLRRTAAKAIAAAREGFLCCISVRPDRPETGYGYVRMGESLGPGVSRVDSFVEKPELATAKAYLSSGEYLWNTGIFAWQAHDFMAAVEEYAPEISASLPALRDGDVQAFFQLVEAISVDVAIMERATRIATIESEFEWDDVGVWSALARTRGTDASGNTAIGKARFTEAEDNIVWVEEVRANLLGVQGLVVVEANGELLVTTRESAPDINRLRARLERGET